MLGKSIKRFFVVTHIDALVASLAARLQWRLLKRLIPAPAYYSTHTRRIKRQGVTFLVQPSDLSQWFMFAGSNDLHVHAAMRVVKPAGGVILDVGANIGHFSLLMAGELRRRRWNKKIIAFEPNPKIHALLMQNIRLNPGLEDYISVFQMGVGDKADQLTISVPHRNSGAGTLTRSYSHESHDSFSVSVNTIDEWVKEPVDFIKIDVEGFEYPVLRGAENTIKKYHPSLYIETHPLQISHEQIFTSLKENGYVFQTETGGNLDPATISGLVNVLAVAL